MPSVLKEKIAGMTPQAAEKLARELQEFIRVHRHPEVTLADFPLIGWLYKAITLEGSIAEQIHLCQACRKDNHPSHMARYRDLDGKTWDCKCQECK